MRHLVVACGAGRAVARNCCNPGPSVGAYNANASRCCTIPIDALGTMYTNHEHGCALNQAEEQEGKHIPMHEMV